MAQVFDYSDSAEGIFNLSTDLLFRELNGLLATNTFYNGLQGGKGSFFGNLEVNGPIVPIAVNVFFDPTYGLIIGDSVPSTIFTTTNPNVGPIQDSIVPNAGNLTFVDVSAFGGPSTGFVRFQGAPAAEILYQPPLKVAKDYPTLEAALYIGVQAAYTTLLSDMRATVAADLSTLDAIFVENVNGGYGTGTLDAPELALEFTPDSTSDLKISDVLVTDNWLDESPEGVISASFAETSRIFESDHVELILTSKDDIIEAFDFAALSLTVMAGSGDDILTVEAGTSQTGRGRQPSTVVFFGEDGNDQAQISSRNVEAYGGAGDDILQVFVETGGRGGGIISGGDGNDDISGRFAVGMILDGGAGDDFITGDLFSGAALLGGAGNDNLIAGSNFNFRNGEFTCTAGGQLSDGADGDDSIIAGDGNDTLDGGLGNDMINPQDGDDLLRGGIGRDIYEIQVGTNFGGSIALVSSVGNNRIEDPDGGTLDIINSGTLRPEFLRSGDDLTTNLVEQLKESLFVRGSVTIGDFFLPETEWQVRLGELGNISDRPIVEIGVLENVFSDRDDAYTPLFAGTFDGLGGDDTLNGGEEGETLLGNAGDDIIYGNGFELRYALPEANQVFRLYQATFNRAPDEGGHKRWASDLFTGESTLAEVREGFVGSQEFRNKYASVDNATFIKQMYINVLDRDFDQGEVTQAEINNWTNRISDNFTRADVVNGFAESQQLINNTLQVANALAVNSNPASWSDVVYRLYQATLDRAPDLAGFEGWSASLADGRPLIEVISGFTNSQEFANTYGTLTDSEDFVKLLYNNVLDRDFDAGEVAQSEITGWTSQLNDTFTRANIVQGFSQSREFTNKTAQELKDWVREQGVDDQINGGAGTNVLAGGSMSDQFVFSQTDGGTNTVLDLEVWDYLSFDGFGYVTKSEAVDHMSQSGGSVVFSDQGTQVTFERFQLDDISNDMILV